MRTLIGLLWVVLVGGCVTETTGNLPEPATLNERVQAQLDLARGYLENRDFTRARSPLNRALEIDPRSVEANVLMGVLSQAESDPELAEQHFKSALRLEPDNAQALNNYASFLYAQQRYSEAVERLRKLVRDPDYRARSQAYENLGLAELRLDNTDLARQAFQRSLLLNDRQARSSLELAVLDYEAGELAAAQEHYDRYRQTARQTPRSLCVGMKLGSAAGDADQLASYAMALQNLFPESREAKQCQVP